MVYIYNTFSSNEREINQNAEKKDKERYTRSYQTSKITPEIIDHKRGGGWSLNRNHNLMFVTRGIVSSDEK